MDNDIIALIKNRRSIRKYTQEDIIEDHITGILEAGRWAPSGLNNQPWRFAVIKNPLTRKKLAELTAYGMIINSCNLCIAVFYNIPDGYNRDKDLMSIGSCIQNMLLAAESYGIGAVWLGEILNRKNDVNLVLDITSDNVLAAIIALGYAKEKPRGVRKRLDSFLLKKD
jgi:nitroreductase